MGGILSIVFYLLSAFFAYSKYKILNRKKDVEIMSNEIAAAKEGAE